MGDGPDRQSDVVFISCDRMASLSDTMFGVAMTLVATTLLPSIQNHTGSVLDTLRDTSGQFFTVVFSFAISARYWVLQHQRLAASVSLTPRETLLHLIFLLLIVLIPISTSLPGLAFAGAIRTSVLIYGVHLSLIALINLLLCREAEQGPKTHVQMVRSALVLGLFALSCVVGSVQPSLAVYFWLAVLVTPPQLSRYLARRIFQPAG